MKITIRAQPKFYFKLTQAQVDLLMKLSELHYDFVCKQASKPGGFLMGWKNCVQYFPDSEVSGSFRDLDTALKILECAEVFRDQWAVMWSIRMPFMQALARANEELPKVEFVVEAG